MGLFNLFGGASKGDINELAQEARNDRNAVIVDVRTREEFEQGHLKDAHNVPLDRIDLIAKVVPDQSTPLYLYCASGARSGSATRFLRSRGFENVTNMGGISSWRGDIVKGSK